MKEATMAEGKTGADQPHDIDAQAREQTGTQQVRLRIDERDMTTNYSNAFRTNATAEEVFVDFGCNLANPVPQQQQQAGQDAPAAEIVFKANDRVILNYYTAKRLAITLGQLVRRHEERFGELQLNAADRVVGGGGTPMPASTNN
jgi:hypothetical protein